MEAHKAVYPSVFNIEVSLPNLIIFMSMGYMGTYRMTFRFLAILRPLTELV